MSVTTQYSAGSLDELNAAVALIDAGPADAYTIDLTADLALTGAIAAITLADGSTLAIHGQGHVIDGGSIFAGLSVLAGTVSIDNLLVSGTVAQGAAGGDGTGGGGGGAGLGGGLFIGSGGTVTLSGVGFLGSRAIGGVGGNGGSSGSGGLGGGPAGGYGGAGGTIGGIGGAGGFGSGGGGGGYSSSQFTPGGNGGAGGFGGGGGGGGGSCGCYTAIGGARGFGGGAGGTGGYSQRGGGGLGAGGAIFVQEGGQLGFGAGTISASAVIGGSGSAYGSAFGSSIFAQGNQVIVLDPATGEVTTIDGGIADMAGSDGLYVGSAALDLTGQGTVVLTAGSTYTGGTVFDNDATLQLLTADAAGTGAIDFGGGNGTLVYNDGSLSLGNQLMNFGIGDRIVLPGYGAGGFSYDSGTGVLSITGGSVDYTFNLAPGARSLAGTNQGASYVIACFVTGTAIATPGGEMPVERLEIGDMVLTGNGASRPVKWIGHRRYSAAQVAANPQLRPVRVAAGALGDGLPRRDLLVSACHALQVRGVLIPAANLVNGRTITRHEAPGPLAYHHVELDEPATVRAEGAAAETFIDAGSRAMFDNVDEFMLRYGNAAPRRPALPRLEEGLLPELARQRLGGAVRRQAARPVGHAERIVDGVLEGWMQDEAAPHIPLRLAVRAGGRLLGHVIANRYRIDLDHAGRGETGGFTFALPVWVTQLAQVEVVVAEEAVPA